MLRPWPIDLANIMSQQTLNATFLVSKKLLKLGYKGRVQKLPFRTCWPFLECGVAFLASWARPWPTQRGNCHSLVKSDRSDRRGTTPPSPNYRQINPVSSQKGEEVGKRSGRGREGAKRRTRPGHRAAHKAQPQSPATEFRGGAKRRRRGGQGLDTELGHRAQTQSSGARPRGGQEEDKAWTQTRATEPSHTAQPHSPPSHSFSNRTPAVNCLGTVIVCALTELLATTTTSIGVGVGIQFPAQIGRKHT